MKLDPSEIQKQFNKIVTGAPPANLEVLITNYRNSLQQELVASYTELTTLKWESIVNPECCNELLHALEACRNLPGYQEKIYPIKRILHDKALLGGCYETVYAYSYPQLWLNTYQSLMKLSYFFEGALIAMQRKSYPASEKINALSNLLDVAIPTLYYLIHSENQDNLYSSPQEKEQLSQHWISSKQKESLELLNCEKISSLFCDLVIQEKTVLEENSEICHKLFSIALPFFIKTIEKCDLSQNADKALFKKITACIEFFQQPPALKMLKKGTEEIKDYEYKRLPINPNIAKMMAVILQKNFLIFRNDFLPLFHLCSNFHDSNFEPKRSNSTAENNFSIILEVNRISEIKNLIAQYSINKPKTYDTKLLPIIQQKIKEWRSDNIENNVEMAEVLWTCRELPGLKDAENRAFVLCQDAATQEKHTGAMLLLAKHMSDPKAVFTWLVKALQKTHDSNAITTFYHVIEECKTDFLLLQYASENLKNSPETAPCALLCYFYRLNFSDSKENNDHSTLISTIAQLIDSCVDHRVLQRIACVALTEHDSKTYIPLAQKCGKKILTDNPDVNLGEVEDKNISLYQLALKGENSMNRITTLLHTFFNNGIKHDAKEQEKFYDWLETLDVCKKLWEGAANKESSSPILRLEQYLILSYIYENRKPKKNEYENAISELFHLYNSLTFKNLQHNALQVEILSALGNHARKSNNFDGAIEHYTKALKINNSPQLKDECKLLCEALQKCIATLKATIGFFPPDYQELETKLKDFETVCKRPLTVTSMTIPSMTNGIGNDDL